jgi:predicted O-linked N-acetylglucosamine transferase (SPINDLY family)
LKDKTLNEYISELKSFINSNNYHSCTDLLLQAIKHYPHEDKLKLNLGNIYKMLDQTNDAIETYTSLLETPLSYMANNNLSLIMLELGEFEKCIKYAQESLKDNNNYNDAKYNLAVGLFERKEYIKSLDICLELINDDDYKNKAFELKIRIEQLTCYWDNYIKTQQLLKTNKITVHPFLHISTVSDESSNYKNACAWKNDDINSRKKRELMKTADKIRLGFLCGEIRNHPTFYLIKNLFKNINKDTFSMYMFSYAHETDKKLHIEQDFNEFIDITSLNAAESKDKIKSYDLDILIDLTTIISHNRSNIIHQDIAKVIIAYLAFPGTTGSHIYDYILTDNVVTPLEKQKYYAERFMFLPKTYQMNNGEINIDIKNERSDFNLPSDGIILGCLNQSFKLDPVFFDIWINIMVMR